MKGGFRQSMAWLHTWSGLVVGWVLFAIFLTGTASYFRQEISLWMQPELRHAEDIGNAAVLAIERLEAIAPDAAVWLIDLPDARNPTLRIFARQPPGRSPAFRAEVLDASSGRPVEVRATHGGDSIYFFHFDLLMPGKWGRWIVGFCTMVMLVAIVSGVITHRRIFRDFFTFRPGRGQRSWLDAHNAFGVLALPYHMMISYTGLITLMVLYMPWGLQLAYPGDRETFFHEAGITIAPPEPAGIAAPLTGVGPLVEQAARLWEGGRAGRIAVYRPGDANALIELLRQDGDQLAYRSQRLLFDGVTGDRLSSPESGPAAETRAVLYGLHLGRFAGPLLRWLFFLSGCVGTLMVASGLVLWLVKRRVSWDAAQGTPFGQRLVSGLNTAVIVGLPIALAVLFWANRLLPLDLAGRAQWELLSAAGSWIVAGLYAALRPPWPGWRELLWCAAALYAALPVLNALTTERHLGVTLAEGDWARAGFDLVVLVFGLLLGGTACKLGTRTSRAIAERGNGLVERRPDRADTRARAAQ